MSASDSTAVRIDTDAILYGHELTATLTDACQPVAEILRQSIDNRAIEAWFQPQMDLATGEIVGAEALGRWTGDNPLSRPLDNPHFSVLFEREGMLAMLTDYMLEEACRAMANGLVTGVVAVNIGAADLADPSLVGRVASLLRRYGVEPERLELEITERGALAETKVTLAAQAALLSLGVRLTIDDFGTGDATVQCLTWLRPSVIKIPREYIATIVEDEHGAVDAAGMLGRACIAFARELGVETVVEGVEDADTIALCRRLGATRAQGYGVARPVPVETYHSRHVLKRKRKRAS